MTDSWIAKAEQLSAAVASEKKGGKLTKIERVATTHNVSAQTAQHLLRAKAFLERLSTEDAGLKSGIADMPYHSVIVLERWYRRDRSGMLSYLANNPAPSVRQLMHAERSSRDLPPAWGSPAEHAIEVLRSANTVARAGQNLYRLPRWSRLDDFDILGLQWQPSTLDYERNMGIEFNALTPYENGIALVVGPTSQTVGHYKRNAKAIWYSSVCAASIYSIVIMLLPSVAAQSACLNSMPLPPSGESGWPDWNAPPPPPGKPKAGPIRPASPNGGIIVVTTPETILDDWRG